MDSGDRALERRVAELEATLARARAELDELRDRESQYRQLVEATDAVFWVGSPDWGQVHYVSPAYSKVWGRSCASLRAAPLSWLEGVHPDDRAQVEEDIREKASGALCEPFRPYRVLHPDGSCRWLLARAFPIYDEDGAVVRIAGLAKDITSIKQVEEQLRRDIAAKLAAQRQLIELTATLETKVEERTSSLARTVAEKELLLAELHHRVKNNMQIVSSLLHLQLSHHEDSRVREALGQCRARISAMALIHEHLYRSHEVNAVNAVNAANYLGELTRELVRAFAEDRELDLTYEIRAGLELELDVAIPCGLIVNELVTNAIKHAFSDRHGGHIRVVLDHDGNHDLRLEVCDDGGGPGPDFQVHDRTLGLRLVQTLAQQLDARITVEHDNGTCVHLHFSPTEAQH